MDKHYQPKDIEQKWYQQWEQAGYFNAEDEAEHPAYCIMIPPPNVTGTLHMGHAFNNTVMDTLIRYHRMRGFNTLWQTGTDHAGIATQMVVERQLEAEGKTRHDLGRESFVERVWQWKKHSGGTINQQFRRLGSSIDWPRERFTMDEGLSEAVKKVFVKLYDEGLIYRGKRLVNWDPVLHTALSDLEVKAEKEEDGYMYYVNYPIVGEDGFITIATTRPETILADGALAVSFGDERYSHLVGKQVHVPLTTRIIPVIIDEYVDPEFGTGCVKITPAHDFNDWQVGQRHEMEVINLMTESATMNENAPKPYQGLDRFVAREQIVKDLKKEKLLVKVEPHKFKPPRGDRSGAIVEPYLTDQWYVKMQSLAEPALKAVQEGTIKFIPDNWKNTYYRWLEDIQDWCISRQIWWGHQIPAWYDDKGNVYVADNEDEVRRKNKLSPDVKLKQDEDVLDTWFSSALWPFSTLGWPHDTEQLKTFYPSSVLITGFDIIFFWVARMIMFGLKFMGEVPFHEVYIHGLILDSHGVKMSKSKGNVIDPIDIIDGISLENLIEKRSQGLMQPQMKASIIKQTKKDYPKGMVAFGTDALRITFASLASTGRDINFDINRVEGYRKFCNKIWNAARFVLIQTEGKNIKYDESSLTIADFWIQAKLNKAVKQVNDAILSYRLDLASQAIYELIWSDYCDWYLELSKVSLNDRKIEENSKSAIRFNLLNILEQILRLVHPIMPYISEEIWQKISPMLEINASTIMLQPYPQAVKLNPSQLDSINKINLLQQCVQGIREIRGKMDIPPAKYLSVYIQNMDKSNNLLEVMNWLISLANIGEIFLFPSHEYAEEAATVLVGDIKLLIPLSDLIDKNEEIKRINKKIANIDNELSKTKAKLENENFVNRAPKQVVQRERAKLKDYQQNYNNLIAQRKKLS